MAKRVSVDRWLFIVTLLLVFVGLVMVFSASAVIAKERYHSGYFFLLRQMGWAVAGFAAMMVGMRVDYKKLKHPAAVFSLLGLTTLMLISVFFLDRAHHTHRWIHFSGFSFQPSELAKPALILFLAFFLETRNKSMDDWRNTLLPAVLPTLVFIGLIVFQPDLGTAIACAAITICILFVAGLETKYLAYSFVGSLLPLYFLIFHVAYRRDRILAFLDPYSDPQGRGFHIIQSLIAVSTGGLTGVGLMEGKEKLFFLPEPHTDFIFSVLGEELGLLGCMAWRADSLAHAGLVRTISRSRDHQHGCRAGIHQYQRGAGIDADERHTLAADLVRRLVHIYYAGVYRRSAQHYQAGGMNALGYSLLA